MKETIKNIIKSISGKSKPLNNYPQYKSVYQNIPNLIKWHDKTYRSFSEIGYIKNPIVNRCINIITKSISSCDILLYETINQIKQEIKTHPILDLIKKPNPLNPHSNLVETIALYLLIDGNVYIQGLFNNETLEEISLLRPDRMEVINASSFIPFSYKYTVDGLVFEFPCNQESGFCDILHIKNFHPLDDLYGLSPMETAKSSIEQYNEIVKWNRSLIQQGGRPSGAITTKDTITEEQFERLKEDLSANLQGSSNAGKIMILEGGMDWKDISISPKDMDYIENKNASARDIAMCFGVPSHLLNIPGDNKFSNLSEAKTILWEMTIIPMLKTITAKLSSWFSVIYNQNLSLELDLDTVTALSNERQILWDNLKTTDFLTADEKRKILGF